jgi:hypothetical protein
MRLAVASDAPAISAPMEQSIRAIFLPITTSRRSSRACATSVTWTCS